jgi:hypothetical protein
MTMLYCRNLQNENGSHLNAKDLQPKCKNHLLKSTKTRLMLHKLGHCRQKGPIFTKQSFSNIIETKLFYYFHNINIKLISESFWSY